MNESLPPRGTTTASTRRTFLQSVALAGMTTMLPRFALADADTDARLVLVILRGALDGLAAVPAYGDSSYAKQQRLRFIRGGICSRRSICARCSKKSWPGISMQQSATSKSGYFPTAARYGPWKD